jgi:hypothetical protein
MIIVKASSQPRMALTAICRRENLEFTASDLLIAERVVLKQ